MQETPPITEPVPESSIGGAAGPAPDSIADGQDKSLDPRSVTVSRISAAITLTILAVPLVIVAMAVAFFSDMGLDILMRLGAGALAFVAFVAWNLIWPGIRYRYASYRVSENGLWIRRGVIWRSEISVPRSRIQHTDVSQGPLQRRFEVATLVLHTAGTQHAAVSLGGLSHETALQLRDYLIEVGEDDAV